MKTRLIPAMRYLLLIFAGVMFQSCFLYDIPVGVRDCYPETFAHKLELTMVYTVEPDNGDIFIEGRLLAKDKERLYGKTRTTCRYRFRYAGNGVLQSEPYDSKYLVLCDTRPARVADEGARRKVELPPVEVRWPDGRRIVQQPVVELCLRCCNDSFERQHFFKADAP